MACGLPVLVPKYGPVLDYLPNSERQTIEVKEYIPTPVTSIMDAFIDVNDFKDKIQWFIDNPKKSIQIGLDNLNIAKKFSWKNIINLWTKMLDELNVSSKIQKNNIIIV